MGTRGGGSAIYLGEGWVLTAYHVGAGATTFQGVSYGLVPNSEVRLVNPPEISSTLLTDLLLYRVNGMPALPSLDISTSVPPVGAQVSLIGRGRDRSPTTSYWDSSSAQTTTPSKYTGFAWTATNTMRWGTNTIDVTNVLQSVQGATERSFVMDFDQVGTTFEAQGATGDSGGAAYFKNPSSGQWELAGLMFAINIYNGQPWGTSVFGNVTYTADLSAYRNQIYSYTALSGDINFDGRVNVFDVNLVSSNWDDGGPTGDANHDGVVDLFDLTLIMANWTQTAGTGANAAALSSASSAPEPSTATLLLFAGTALLFRWRVRRRDRRGA